MTQLNYYWPPKILRHSNGPTHVLELIVESIILVIPSSIYWHQSVAHSTPGHKVNTGSTIRFWHKVKTWPDQMCWQIYQKLMLSGFLNSGNLCLTHQLNLFWPHRASTASDRKSAQIQHEIWWFCQNIFFSKHQNKVLKLLNSRIWKTLKSSVVIFNALETSSA